jgi:F1F0 ATPase subunit 2
MGPAVTPFGAIAAVVLGLALGAGYFGGLWWTLASLPRWRRPGVALLLSFALRGAVVVAAFVLLARAGLPPLALAFAGFLTARVALVAWLRPTIPRSGAGAEGVGGRGPVRGGERRLGAP